MKLKFTHKILIVFIIIFLLFSLSPTFNITGLDTIFNSVTFIFGVLYGFEISVVLANFSNLKTSLAILNGQLMGLHVNSNAINNEIGQAADEVIEQYLMVSIDEDLVEHYKTDKEFNELLDFSRSELLKFEANNEADGQAVQFIFQSFYDLSSTRNQIEQVAPKFIEFPEWLMLGTLSLIMSGILFLQRTDSLSIIVSSILVTTIIGSLIVLNDIDSNDLQEGFLEYGVFNSTLSNIGKMQYYPDFAIKDGLIKIAKGIKYRKGIFSKNKKRSEVIVFD